MQLYQGDCLEVMKTIPDESVDLVITDPPYKTITGGKNNGMNTKRPKGILSENNGMFKHNNIGISSWIPEIYRILREGSHCYIFTNSLNLQDMLNEATKVGFNLHNLLVWEKNNCTPSQYYMKNCEYVLFLRKGKAKWINHIGESKTVHKFDNIIGNKRHPTEKPVNLLKMYILNSSSENQIVFDPFMGSGSTGVACVNTGRDFVGIELDPEYFQIAENRIEKVKEEIANG